MPKSQRGGVSPGARHPGGPAQGHGLPGSPASRVLPGLLPAARAAAGPVLFEVGNWMQKNPELKRNVLPVDLKTQNTGWCARKVVLKRAVSKRCVAGGRGGMVLSLRSAPRTQRPEGEVSPRVSSISPASPRCCSSCQQRRRRRLLSLPAPSPEGRRGGRDIYKPAHSSSLSFCARRLYPGLQVLFPAPAPTQARRLPPAHSVRPGSVLVALAPSRFLVLSQLP